VAASPARLREQLEPEVTAAGYDLEDLTVTAAGKRSVVRVVVDQDGGVTLDDIADVSRTISDALDALDEREPGVLGATYVLEVSSPGVDRPLTAARHWRRNLQRLVTATLRDGGAVTGRVVAAEDESVTLDVDGVERVLALPDVARGVVQVEFTRKDAELAELEGPDEDDEEETP
jgi:ribosome maturation factor RimP